jgi:hypothetical protein
MSALRRAPEEAHYATGYLLHELFWIMRAPLLCRSEFLCGLPAKILLYPPAGVPAGHAGVDAESLVSPNKKIRL